MIRDQAASETVDAASITNFGPEKARIFLADVDHGIGGSQAIVDQARGALDACSVPAAVCFDAPGREFSSWTGQ